MKVFKRIGSILLLALCLQIYTLISGFDYAIVTVESYGAVGNGTTDDTAAIQSALDSGNDVSFGAGKTYRITSTLDMDQSGTQEIIGNGATIIISSGDSWKNDTMFYINKSSGVAVITGLNFDGNKKIRFGVEIQSSFSLDDVEIREISVLSGTNLGTIGLYIPNFASRTYSSAYMNNVTVTDIDGYPDGTIASPSLAGVAKGLQVQLNGAYNNHMLIENSEFSHVYGDDADAVDLFIVNGHPEFTGSFTMKNSTVAYASRRLLKSRISHSLFENVTFTASESTNPRLYDPAGTYSNSMISHFNFGTDPDNLRDVTYKNCTLNGTTRESKILIYEAEDITFEDCDINRGRIAFTDHWGTTRLYGNNFDSNSYIFSYNVNGGWDAGAGLADCYNVKSSGSWDQLTATDYIVLSCDPAPPPVDPTPTTSTPDGIINETSGMLIAN